MDSASTARELLGRDVWERERLNRGLPLGARRCEELMIAVKTIHLRHAGEANSGQKLCIRNGGMPGLGIMSRLVPI